MNAYRTKITADTITVLTAGGRVVWRATQEVYLHWEIRIGRERHKAIGGTEEVLVKGFKLYKDYAARKMHWVRKAPCFQYQAR